MTTQTQTDIRFYLLSGLTILLTGFMAFFGIYDYITIGLLGHSNGYPFGAEGISWHLKTADLYSKVSLISGLIFLIILAFCIWSTLRKKRIGLFIAFLLSFLFVMILHFIKG